MTFEERFHKEYEPAELQIKQCAEKGEVLSVPAKVYLEDLKKAFEAGQNEIKERTKSVVKESLTTEKEVV